MPEWIPWVIVISAVATVAGVGITASIMMFKGGKWVGRVEESLAGLREDIRRILSWQDAPTIRSKSPLELSDIGEKVSKALDLPEMAERLAPDLMPKVESKHAYDIQEFCFEYLRDEYRPSAEDEERIKQCAYDNGLDRDDILDALAIVLRDRMLSLLPPPF